MTTEQIAKLNKSNRAMQDVSGGTLLSQIDIAGNGAAIRYAYDAVTIVASTDAQDLEIVVPDGSIIKGVYVQVETKEDTGTTKTIDIGISGGDEDGFLDGVSVAAAGTIKGTLASGGQTLGALLSVDEDGSGALVPEPYVCVADTTLCYTLGADDFAELVANVIVEYIELN